MQRIIDLFEKNQGYAQLKTLKQAGIHTDKIRELLNGGIIERVKPGLYKLVDMPVVAEQSMIDLCMAMPLAVVCLHSALSYYELTTTVPSFVMIALPRGSKPTKIAYPPFKVYHFSERNYEPGVEKKDTEQGRFRIYNREKTIVDCFRYRKRLGEDVALEGLRNYLSARGANINTLVSYARKGRMDNVMRPYIEASLAS
jgi:predicted transcriptional regulator of viral defense system